jgi:DNA invertase Pin-like site-specific DNA recombinase
MLGMVAEMELDFIKARQRDGIGRAKSKGEYLQRAQTNEFDIIGALALAHATCLRNIYLAGVIYRLTRARIMRARKSVNATPRQIVRASKRAIAQSRQYPSR